MANISESKFPWWFKHAKDIVKEDDDCLLLNNEQLIAYINEKIPLQFKLSRSYILQILYYNETTSSTIGFEMSQEAILFREWWEMLKIHKELKQIKLMKANDKSWQRDLAILERRHRENWKREQSIDLKADQNIKQQINISFKKV